MGNSYESLNGANLAGKCNRDLPVRKLTHDLLGKESGKQPPLIPLILTFPFALNMPISMTSVSMARHIPMMR
jgi:hypothetical protein